ncbi:MAG: alpha/beta hydrolase [Planctomycetota bacterium]
MARMTIASLLPRLMIVAGLLVGLAPYGHAQNDRPGSGGEDRSQRRDDDRQSRWRIPDDATSDNNRMLERILERYPQSDADKDGKLNADEARKFIEAERERQREQWRDRNNWRRNRLEPTFDNVRYGADDKHHFDLYRAKTEEPAPLVLFFHGGQFISGDERSTRSIDARAFLEAGISVASIDYRETNTEPFPGPFDDAQMVIQFIRFYAEQLDIDPTRIAAIGDEAGGNLALYLAMHDDLLDPKVLEDLEDGRIDDPREKLPDGPIQLNEDGDIEIRAEQSESDGRERPEQDRDQGEAEEEDEVVDTLDDILLEELIPWDAEAIEGMSSRLAAAAVRHPIATFDPRAWEPNNLPMNDHERLMTKYLGVRYLEPLNDPVVIDIVERVSPIALASADDPPLLLLSRYTDLPLKDNTIWTIMRHHPMQSKLIAEAMKAKGAQAIVRYRGMDNDPGIGSTQFLTDRLK